MKKTIIALGLMLGVYFVGKAQPVSTGDIINPNAADIVFETELINYGTIEHNADGNREFKFKNVGKEPLIISNCVGSCGCTVPTWPKDPIKPGQSGVIHVKYATDRTGSFEKQITVTSNAKMSTKVLKIIGTVKTDPTPVVPATPAPAQVAPAAVPGNH